ncbi:aminoacyl-histidine dipeptidase [Eubacteriales bacterium KG127]
MRVLGDLKPKKVFEFFEDICEIPHGSYNTKQISDYLKKFAEERNLTCYQDEDNNIIIIKDATAGYENSEPVILQGHMDMVCEKTPESNIDFAKDGLEIYVDGDWVKANGTTLGGDNGIAVAMGLSILDSEEYEHPRIEFIATADEEVGLLGAASIDVSKLTAKKFINIDSEEEGIFTVSCAGGITLKNSLKIDKEEIEGQKANLKISGLLGGHSGIQIDKERANANILLGRILNEIRKKYNYNLVTVNGGSKDNAITKLSEAVIIFDKLGDEQIRNISEIVAEFKATINHEYKATDPGINVEITFDDTTKNLVLDADSTERVINYLVLTPYGVQNMSKEIDGLVETSLNLGILKTEETTVSATYAVRSSSDSRRDMLVDKLSVLAKFLGGKTELSGAYPGWEYMADSSLREKAIEVFVGMYGKEPKIEAIHAGLECGLFAGKIDGLDCISIGPDMDGVHTPDERLSISSTERVFDFLVSLLKECK